MQGWIQDFHLGGGGKKLCARTHIHEREARSPLRPGPGPAQVRALEALGVFDALSYYLSLIFKQSDTKWDIKTIFDHILGGGGAPVSPPLKPALGWFSSGSKSELIF